MDACDRRGNEDLTEAMIPLCWRHGYEVALRYKHKIKAELDHEAAIQAARDADREQAEGGNPTGTPLVYYAQIGDYIKIGYSTRLRQRLRTLRADHLLAVEPGGLDLERERHAQFRAERIDLRRENFRPSPELLDHIETLRRERRLPHWAILPRTTVVTTRKADK